jgi:hypothetical protein
MDLPSALRFVRAHPECAARRLAALEAALAALDPLSPLQLLPATDAPVVGGGGAEAAAARSSAAARGFAERGASTEEVEGEGGGEGDTRARVSQVTPAAAAAGGCGDDEEDKHERSGGAAQDGHDVMTSGSRSKERRRKGVVESAVADSGGGETLRRATRRRLVLDEEEEEEGEEDEEDEDKEDEGGGRGAATPADTIVISDSDDGDAKGGPQPAPQRRLLRVRRKASPSASPSLAKRVLDAASEDESVPAELDKTPPARRGRSKAAPATRRLRAKRVVNAESDDEIMPAKAAETPAKRRSSRRTARVAGWDNLSSGGDSGGKSDRTWGSVDPEPSPAKRQRGSARKKGEFPLLRSSRTATTLLSQDKEYSLDGFVVGDDAVDGSEASEEVSDDGGSGYGHTGIHPPESMFLAPAFGRVRRHGASDSLENNRQTFRLYCEAIVVTALDVDFRKCLIAGVGPPDKQDRLESYRSAITRIEEDLMKKRSATEFIKDGRWRSLGKELDERPFLSWFPKRLFLLPQPVDGKGKLASYWYGVALCELDRFLRCVRCCSRLACH